MQSTEGRNRRVVAVDHSSGPIPCPDPLSGSPSLNSGSRCQPTRRSWTQEVWKLFQNQIRSRGVNPLSGSPLWTHQEVCCSQGPKGTLQDFQEIVFQRRRENKSLYFLSHLVIVPYWSPYCLRHLIVWGNLGKWWKYSRWLKTPYIYMHCNQTGFIQQ